MPSPPAYDTDATTGGVYLSCDEEGDDNVGGYVVERLEFQL